ncbi:MAG: winged helix DNA-binding domain-containing protein [Actinomycetota bacterium]|nr:winged helix DNA-binding domain-containing protein [Actinomycetota bacterium]
MPGQMTEVTWEQVTAWRIARGHLARRIPAAKLEPAVQRTCGAHAQIMSTVPLALAARVNGVTAQSVDDAIADRRLVKTWAMRGTLHVFAAGDLPLYCAAQKSRDQYQNPSFLRYFGLEEADLQAVLDAVPHALDGRRLSRGELARELLRITKRPHLEERLLSGWGEMLKPAAFRGLLCFGPGTGRNVTFVRPDQWIGRWEEHDTDDALMEVFRRFLGSYGPASVAEAARWWGVRPPEARRVLRLLGDELAEVVVGGDKRFVLARDAASIARARRREGVRLIPSFDQLLVMSAPHKEAVVDPAFADRVYTVKPIAVWSLPAVLVDGRVRAAWKLEKKTRRALVRVAPFGKLTRKQKAALEDESARLAKTIGAETELVLEGT